MARVAKAGLECLIVISVDVRSSRVLDDAPQLRSRTPRRVRYADYQSAARACDGPDSRPCAERVRRWPSTASPLRRIMAGPVRADLFARSLCHR